MPPRIAVPILIIVCVLIFYQIRSNEQQLFETGGVFDVSLEGAKSEILVLKWRGEVEAPMALSLQRAFNENADLTQTVELVLDSPGGSLREGHEVIDALARIKQTHALETVVPRRAICLSMCVPIYLQGDTRSAGKNARFMFHEPKATDFYTGKVVARRDFEQQRASRSFFNTYFTNSPMEPAFRDQLEKEWVGKDVWYSAQELVSANANIVQRTF